MAITLPCSCGKKLKMKDELAGKRIKCPACAAVLTVPEPEAEEVELEPVEPEAPAEPDEEPEEREAPAEQDDDADEDRPRPKKKKKKKKKKSKFELLDERNRKEEEYEKKLRRQQLLQHTIASWAYVALGGVITIGALYAIISFRDTLMGELTYGALVVFILLIGLGAIAKGVIGVIGGVMEGREDD